MVEFMKFINADYLYILISVISDRSSDDISSGYSSGEALQSTRSAHGDSLVRTSSVGARTRAKPRSTTKKTPEVPNSIMRIFIIT